MNSKKQICVVGAGIVGLSVATHLLETYRSEIVVTIIADAFCPDTIASDKSASIILSSTPSLVSNDLEKIANWKRKSLDNFHRLFHGEDGGRKPGINYSSGFSIKPPGQHGPMWYASMFPDYQDVKNSDIPTCNDRESARCSTYLVDPSEYMSYLTDKIQSFGGILVKNKVDSLSSLNSFEVIINCTGLGAKELASDPSVYPIKGILVSVKAPWVKEWINEGVVNSPRSALVVPRNHDVVLGGFNEGEVNNSLIDHDEVQGIITRCTQVVPSLAKAEVLRAWSGVRPMRRGGIRLEEDCQCVNGSTVVHNYGHGSYGVTLAWGCAEDVSEIVGQYLGIKKKPQASLQSKL